MALINMREGWLGQGLQYLINYMPKVNTMVEVGSYAGHSADMFASSGKIKTLWCIDPWRPGYDNNDGASYSDFNEVEAAFDSVARKHSRVIKKFKGTLDDFICTHREVHPDMIYIDACHTYDGCKIDLQNALKLNPRIISGHDYSDTWAGVKQAVNEVVGTPHITFLDTSWLIHLHQ